jgi:hypothetical protein
MARSAEKNSRNHSAKRGEKINFTGTGRRKTLTTRKVEKFRNQSHGRKENLYSARSAEKKIGSASLLWRKSIYMARGAEKKFGITGLEMGESCIRRAKRRKKGNYTQREGAGKTRKN